MNVRRLATGLFIVAAFVLPAGPAFAHGAPVSPISRSAACAAGGGLKTGTAACMAARSANGGPFGTFDDVRVPNVNGNDRKFVPDGQLCGGGLDQFKGLNIARDDFPATTVSAGENLTIEYEATQQHRGSFRVYLSNPGYNPEKKLTWDDLGSKPLTEVANPTLKSGAYTFRVKLPVRTGRQMLYIVWQTTSTPDSYYSCSDLVFTTAAAKSVRPLSSPKPSHAPSRAPSSPAPRHSSAAPATARALAATTDAPPPSPQALTPVGDTTEVTLGHQILIGAGVLAVGALAVAGFGQLRRRRAEKP